MIIIIFKRQIPTDEQIEAFYEDLFDDEWFNEHWRRMMSEIWPTFAYRTRPATHIRAHQVREESPAA